MDASKPLDLQKELTCYICTELLYQPLTLLDCLHTFCGSCLKEWFRFQAAKHERNPSPPRSGTALFNCPSCRAAVRDTRQNATVVTLLDMFVTANPDKARTKEEMEDMAQKYKPGEQVLPKVKIRGRTADERRAEDEDQRLIDEVREMSLREAAGASPLPPRMRRQRDKEESHIRSRSSDDPASGNRRRREGSHRPRRDDDGRPSMDQLHPNSEHSRPRSSESRQRQVEHQSSLRSLIGSGDMSERDIEREIEDFARQIQEEGLLDGLDLDNLDITRNDELGRKITEAYRRRQRERQRQEPARRSNHSAHSNSSRIQGGSPYDSDRRQNRPYPTRRPSSATGHRDDRSRPPTSLPAALGGRETGRESRRRATSGGRATTTGPATPAYDASRQAAHSVTDLTTRNAPDGFTTQRLDILEGKRSSSTPNTGASTPPPRAPSELPATTNRNNLPSFASRAQAELAPSAELAPTSYSGNPGRSSRPADLAIVHTSVVSPKKSPNDVSPQRHQLYPEPSIGCSRCRKQHIEYELHYNCHTCSHGQWNICLDCYRAGKGCMYWFGFGYGAWRKWELKRQQDSSIAPPHMLTASRYVPPPRTPGGADGRRTLTRDDPKNRLESGTFCARCYIWTNECYWRCDVCNEGDWGFCNDCVNQGKSCTHLLLPLSHEAAQSSSQGRPVSPRSPGRPPTATILTGPQASNIGPFRPLSFTTRCDVCQDSIPPEQPRYHCFSCTSALVPDARLGDYDICFECYGNLIKSEEISTENGSGWRRCLNGHRMAIVGFTDGQIGQWRYVDRDIVGGRVLRTEPFESPELNGMEVQKWSWKEGETRIARLVTQDVKATAPQNIGSGAFAQTFPPDGGTGRQGVAGWAWYPKPGAEDELLFPRGAEIREIEDVNGDWFFGTYMGAIGLFPAPYVRIHEDS